MVTTGARSSTASSSTTPPEVEYWAQFRRGDYRGGPAYTGTYGFDWVEWKRNSANNPATAYDDLTAVTGTPISNFTECYDPGLPAAGSQPATPAHYAPVSSSRQHYETELHKGYTKLIVRGNDYYVPWLSLRPHQTVRLKLEVEFLNKEPVKPTNLFTVAAHPDYLVTINGQTNNATPPPAAPAGTTPPAPAPGATPAPAPIRLPPVNKQVLDVTIECLRPSAATALRVEDEHGNVVGQLNIADNTLVYELPLRVVYVLPGKPMNPKDPLGTTPPRPLYAPPGALAALRQQMVALRSQGVDLPTFLNEHSLNQALITCAFEQPAAPHQLLMDLDQWKKDGMYRAGQVVPAGLAPYLAKITTAVFGAGFTAFQGIILYVFSVDAVPDPNAGGPTAAAGSHLPVGARTLNVFATGLNQGKASTIAHELGHVLGLTHAFPMPAGYENAEIQKLINGKASVNGVLPGLKTALAVAIAAAATPPTPAERQDIQNRQTVIQAYEQQRQEADAQLTLYANNAFKFVQQSTINLMDYDPGDRRCMLWHWQWALLQADLVAYYGTTSAAR